MKSQSEKVNTAMGEMLMAHREVLPTSLRSHMQLETLLASVNRFDSELSCFHQYYEWNLKNQNLDFSLVLPVVLFAEIRLNLREVTAGLLRAVGDFDSFTSKVAQDLFESIENRQIDDPLFPRAVSFSFEELCEENTQLNFLFLDYFEGIKLDDCRTQLRKVFEMFGTGFDASSDEFDTLARVSKNMRLAHCGFGKRNGRLRLKTYLSGSLSDFLDSGAGAASSELFGVHKEQLHELAAVLEDRACHMVVDVCDAEIIRVGFELNVDSEKFEDYGARVLDSSLWRTWGRTDEQDELIELMRSGGNIQALADGETSRLFVSHFKISFDGSGVPEWKVYLACTKEV